MSLSVKNMGTILFIPVSMQYRVGAALAVVGQPTSVHRGGAFSKVLATPKVFYPLKFCFHAGISEASRIQTNNQTGIRYMKHGY